ncbi:hypothetical protein [Candidatus Francisella endociliophora]|nr:hypothetical protein [Francisella sp. FSC1006]
MIFGFVVLVTVSGLVYIVRYNLLSIKGLAGQEAIMTAEQQYIQSIVEKGSIRLGKNKLGNYDFENILQSRQPIFSNKNVDVSLYNAEPSAITSDIIHKLIFRKNLKITKDIIFKNLPKHSMINYYSEFVPINVPYIDINRMNDIEKYYHLNDKGNISDSKNGFIGYIEKEYSWLLVSVNNRARVISLRNLDISDNYEVKIGWHLVKGHWQMLMAIYDKHHLYIYRTQLNDLLNNFDKAILNLSTAVKTFDSSTNIVAVDWHYTKDNTEPNLAVLSTYYDEDDKASVRFMDFTYNKFKNTYDEVLKDTINGLGEINDSNVFIEALDPYYILAKSPLYVFAGDRMIVYNIAKDQRLKKEVINLNHVVENKPVIVKKDDYSYYVLVFANDRYYQYTYTKNTDVINVSEPVIYPDQKIQNIVIKYGLKFIVTKKHIYIDDFKNQQLAEVSI